MAEGRIPSRILFPVVFVSVLGLSAYILFIRFVQGLAAVTNLTDDMPWGLWKAFNVFSGVALASGGFTITAAVVIFHLEKYRPVVRPAVLTAFIGYLMVILSLAVDVGRPWNLWRPLFYWNERSVLWEVGLCVIFYTTVLFLEFLPLVWEKLGFRGGIRFWGWLTPVFVIAGVTLSFLHQSSLGSVYLIVPGKLHPLWYSPALPLFFFLSSVALGLAVTSCGAHYSSRAFGKSFEPHITDGLSRATAFVLIIYLAARALDLGMRGNLDKAFRMDTASLFFLAETLLLGLVPAGLLLIPAFRRDPGRVAVTQAAVIFGVVLGRMNVTLTAFQLGTGARYIPHAFEVAVSLIILFTGSTLFYLAVKHLPVFGAPESISSPPAQKAPEKVRMAT